MAAVIVNPVMSNTHFSHKSIGTILLCVSWDVCFFVIFFFIRFTKSLVHCHSSVHISDLLAFFLPLANNTQQCVCACFLLQLTNETSIGIKKKVMRSHCLIWTCFDVKPFLSLFWINSCYLIIFFLSSIANKANRPFWIISIHFLIVWGLWMKYFF